ncbi:MAG: 2-C-methyl-D-erythritol 2,4-cyclodiphosphate synthase [Candidatus Omnitrophica bacterium]|nr:2-C-methyl-D-erythritol 2,4-cyclodiphosphate synthase [Candidatus Omnitrophota bacterium]
MDYKIGLGFDIHRFASGRKLVLGGVEIPFHLGLDGHSDADVILHAVCDALLGALGAGDIGEHFPNTDERYRGVSSLTLLDTAAQRVADQGFRVGNLDITVLAEQPHLKEYKQQMRARIASRLSIAEPQVNIKATTMESLGAIGRSEGIAAQAVVLLMQN